MKAPTVAAPARASRGRVAGVIVASGVVYLSVAILHGTFGGSPAVSPEAEAFARHHASCSAGSRTDWITEDDDVRALFVLGLGPDNAAIPDLGDAGYVRRGAAVCEVLGQQLIHLSFDSLGREPASVYVACAGEKTGVYGSRIGAGSGALAGVVVTAVGVSVVLVAAPSETTRLAGLLRGGPGG